MGSAPPSNREPRPPPSRPHRPTAARLPPPRRRLPAPRPRPRPHLRRRDRTRRTALRSTAHGTATWGDPAILDRATGLILGEHQGRLLRFEGEDHLLTLAPTGSGKGIGAVFPNLLDYPGTVLVTDIKGENYAVTARYRRDQLHHDVQALDPFGLVGGTARYNPMDLVDPRRPDAHDYARLLASMLVVAEPGSPTAPGL